MDTHKILHKYVLNAYNTTINRKGGYILKRVDLIRRLESNGWHLLRNGSSHDIYTNGVKNETIPRHNEIGEKLAKTILKRTGV